MSEIISSYNEETFEAYRAFVFSFIQKYALLNGMQLSTENGEFCIENIADSMPTKTYDRLLLILSEIDTITSYPMHLRKWTGNTFKSRLHMAVVIASNLIDFMYNIKELCV